MSAHPDRTAATLANLDEVRRQAAAGPWSPPGDGAHDCRIDLKLALWCAQQAAARSPRAAARLQPFAGQPDLLAGTVQDGVARGLLVACEEALALAGGHLPAAGPEADDGAPPVDPLTTKVLTGKELRKHKDLLVAAGGARVRFSRKEGLLFVARDPGVNSPNCLRFEDRADLGSLDGFRAREDERPRLFSAQFLQPVRWVQGKDHGELLLAGRLGRTPAGFACRVRCTGRAGDPAVCVEVAIENRHHDHRLRARFLGVPADLIRHECTDVREVVANDAGGFVAFTLVRACGRLLVDGTAVPVPGAQCAGWIRHRFRLGPTT